MRSKILAFQGNDQVITLEGLSDSSGNLITGATLTGTITSTDGLSIGTISFSDVSGAPGNYKAALPSSSVPVLAGCYVFTVTGTYSGLNIKTVSDLIVLAAREL